jgi:hypothetical protein
LAQKTEWLRRPTLNQESNYQAIKPILLVAMSSWKMHEPLPDTTHGGQSALAELLRLLMDGADWWDRRSWNPPYRLDELQWRWGRL